ncbi:MAG: hypothetical protein MJ175_00845 [Clostridia bacterium]|nr:hypothetical protein [Clostridia bacterium]
MNVSKTTKSLFAAGLFAVLLISCGAQAETDKPVQTQAAGGDGTQAAAEAVTEEPRPDFYSTIRADLDQGVDYDGYHFGVVSYDEDSWDIYIAPETQNGEIVNDAAFRRNSEVEELLNIKVEAIKDKNYTKKFRDSVMAGDGEAYDMICFWSPGDYSAMITGQVAYDWKNVPHVRLDQDYYNQTVNKTFTLAGRQYFAVSDFTYTVHQHFRILFNKDLIKNYDLPNPYEDVYSGNWTYNRMLEYCKGLYQDLDGDGKRSLGDTYGLVLNYAFASVFPLSGGELPLSCGENGFEFNLFSERITTMVEAIVGLHTNPDVYVNTQGNDQYQIFRDGNAVFETYGSDPALLRDMEFDFGYLPYPKFDENQKDYVVVAAGGLMVLPSAATDIDRSGMIVEALSAASHAYLADAFVDQYIENKVLRDEDSQQIYRMMRSLETYDLAYNVDPSNQLANYAYYSYFMQKKTADVASRYASVKDKIEKKFTAMYDLILDQE